ncbi:MAG: N-acetylneuraminate synthase family protein [Candidatus Woesearchaeota archaeon]|nr:N-acetylneuraminate synthase family protein [Candidatus Woesearchaeota archaeon]
MEIKIADKIIGKGNPCLIIAEAGVNHNGSFELAKKLIDAALECGADVVKFQTFKADKEAIKNAPKAKYQKELTSENESQYDMIKKLELSDEETIAMKEYADEKGIIFMSTPYEIECVDLLCRMKVPALKVGSGEITNHFLLEHMARTGLPIILSTGMSNISEVRDAVNNHTSGIFAAVASVAYGANVIEKHFTTDKNLSGPDHKASLNPDEFSKMVSAIRFVEKFRGKQFDEDNYLVSLKEVEKSGFITKKELSIAGVLLGSSEKKPADEELETRAVTRRSIVAAKKIIKGEIIKRDFLSFKKPGTGIPPFEIKKIVGKMAKKEIDADELIKWDFIE